MLNCLRFLVFMAPFCFVVWGAGPNQNLFAQDMEGINASSSNKTSTFEDSEDDDSLAEDDSLSDSEDDDSLAEDDDGLEDTAEQEEIEVKHVFSFQPKLTWTLEPGVGVVEADRGFPLGNKPATEDTNHLAGQLRLDASSRFLTRFSFSTELRVGYNQTIDNLTKTSQQDATFEYDQAIIAYRNSAHYLSAGYQRFEIGTLDNSPMDILSRPSEEKMENFGVGEKYAPTSSFFYQWTGANQGFSFYHVPYFTETENQKTTRSSAVSGDTTSGAAHKDWYGWQYRFSANALDAKIGSFRWFDRDWETDYKANVHLASAISNPTTSSSFAERVSTFSFNTLEMDLTFSDYVWRLEGVRFKNKNRYDVSKRDNTTVLQEIVAIQSLDPTHTDGVVARLNTYKFREDVIGTSIERKFDSYFVLGNITHRKLYNVQAGTNIYLFENEKTAKQYQRDLTRTEASLFVSAEIGKHLDVETTLSTSAPFRQNLFLQIWKWSPKKFPGNVQFKIQRLSTENLLVLDQKQTENKSFLTYEYPL